ncbi:MAG: type IV pilus biogenesis/stability protein PilW [Wenzhouxiangella sp.]
MSRLMRVMVAVSLLALLAACAATSPRHGETGSGMDRISPVRGAEVNTRLGIGYMERGQLQLAMEKLETALRHDPEHVPAHLALALIYETINDSQRAGRHYRQAARLAPHDGATQNAYGVFLCRQGDFAQAERHFMLAVDDPFYDTPEVAWTNAGACSRRDGNLERAERQLRTALDYDSQYPDALFQLAWVSHLRNESLRARAFLQRFEAVAGADPGALLLGYRIESGLNNPAQADGYARRLEENFPDSSEARELRRLSEQND